MAATRPLRFLKKLKPSSVSYVLVAWMFMLFVAITMVVYHTAEDNLAATEEAMGDDSLLDDVRAARLRAKSSRTHNSRLERRQGSSLKKVFSSSYFLRGLALRYKSFIRVVDVDDHLCSLVKRVGPASSWSHDPASCGRSAERRASHPAAVHDE